MPEPVAQPAAGPESRRLARGVAAPARLLGAWRGAGCAVCDARRGRSFGTRASCRGVRRFAVLRRLALCHRLPSAVPVGLLLSRPAARSQPF